jgi:ketosteroid isomerase-like protein
MSDHPNAELVRAAYAAVDAGDGTLFHELLADDVKWHFPGRSSVAGDYEGREAVLGHFVAFSEATGGTLKADVAAVLGDDKFAIAIEHVTAERAGKTYNRHDVVVFRMKNGKAAEGWLYPESQYELDDLLR